MNHDKCDKCGKHKAQFKDLDTKEETCWICSIKEVYSRKGIKGIYRLLRLYIRSNWILSWADNFVNIIGYLILIFLTIISVSSFAYILVTKQFFLIINSLISLVAIIYLWRDLYE